MYVFVENVAWDFTKSVSVLTPTVIFLNVMSSNEGIHFKISLVTCNVLCKGY